MFINIYGFPSGSVSKEATYNAVYTGDTGLIPGLGRIPGGGHGNILQYFECGGYFQQFTFCYKFLIKLVKLYKMIC